MSFQQWLSKYLRHSFTDNSFYQLQSYHAFKREWAIHGFKMLKGNIEKKSFLPNPTLQLHRHTEHTVNLHRLQ